MKVKWLLTCLHFLKRTPKRGVGKAGKKDSRERRGKDLTKGRKVVVVGGGQKGERSQVTLL